MNEGLAAEVAALRAEVERLDRRIRPLLQAQSVDSDTTDTPDSGTPAPRMRAGNGIHPDALVLEQRARERGVAGLLTRYGYYGSHQRTYLWSKDEQSAEELLDQDVEQVARVLSALGNRHRLLLLKAILEKPASAAELVERLGMGTTGQAYHHLNVLQAADLITQESRGQFAFIGHRVQAFLTLLAGVSDVLDSRYSTGAWTEGADKAEADQRIDQQSARGGNDEL